MSVRSLVFLSCCSLGVALFSSNLLAKKSGFPALPPTVVTTTQAKLRPWNEDIRTVGTLAAHQGITIKPEVSGRITDIFFHSGDTVAAGDPLLQINPDAIKASLALAQAESNLSEQEYQRQKKLVERNVETKALFDKFTAQRKVAQAKVTGQMTLLNQTLIRAPFHGQLGLKQVEIGDYILAGQSVIVNLQNIDSLKVNFKLPEHHLNHITKGQTITVLSPATPKTPIHGTILAHDSLIDATTRTIAVRAEIPNPKHLLLPGGFVNVALHVSHQAVMTLPQTAIIYAPEGRFVYIVKDNKAIKTPVIIGPRIKDDIIIHQGLSAEDKVVTAGQFKLSDGAVVAIQP